MATQLDRRIRRTRHRLKQKLLELINERPFDAISILEIVDRADVGRSTFYSHFSTKDELLFSGFEDWLHSLTGAPADGRGSARSHRFRFSLPLLSHIREQRRFFLATIVRGHEAYVHGVVGAFLGLVAWWLESGASMTAEAVDEAFQRLANVPWKEPVS